MHVVTCFLFCDLLSKSLGVHVQSAAEGDLPARNVLPFGLVPM